MNRRIRLIHAINSAQPLLHAAIDEADLAAANARIVEGKMTIPYGLWPVTIKNEKGETERVVQRLSKPVAERLVAAWNSFRGRVAKAIAGGSIFLGHPDYSPAANAADWKRLGKTVGMEAQEDAWLVHGELTPDAIALCSANAALAPSPHWGLVRTAEKDPSGLPICEPAVYYSMGLVPRPNIAGAAINEAQPPPPEIKAMDPLSPEAAAANERELAALASDLAEAEAQLKSLTSERDARLLDLAARDKTIAEISGNVAALQADVEALRAKVQAAADAEAVARQATESAAAARKQVEDAYAAQAASASAAMNETLDSICSAAANAGLILPADVPHWKAKLAAANAAIAELIAPDRVRKSESVVSAARLDAANAALGGVSAAARFEQLVRAHQNATGQNWPTAFNAMRAAHPELYNLMPNGGRA